MAAQRTLLSFELSPAMSALCVSNSFGDVQKTAFETVARRDHQARNDLRKHGRTACEYVNFIRISIILDFSI